MSYFLKNRISAYMIFASLFLLGIISVQRLPVSLMPQVVYPGISVIIEYPGISPGKIEQIITKPVERVVKTVPGIQKISSVSEEGKSRININFQMETDIKIAALKVREKIALIRDYFPREVQEPVVLRYDPGDKPVLIATVKIDKLKLHEIREKVERKIKPKLQRIEGVSEINIVGGAQKEIHINLDKDKYEAKAVSLNAINQVIQENNISLPGGLVTYGSREYSIYSAAKFKDISEIAELPVLKTSQGSFIRLYDVSDVLFAFKDKEDIARLNGKEEVVIYIHKAGDANTINVCQAADKLLHSLGNYQVDIIYNQSEFIQIAIDNVISSCIWGAIIVILVLFLFVRKTHIVLTIGISIPISVIIVFMFMYFFKIELNIISLSGLALGAGMIVDNCIVITESIFQHKKINLKTIKNSISLVNKAIISSTFTTIAVFFPIVFGTISTKKMYGGLAFTVSTALLISLSVSIILVPAVFIAFLKNSKAEAALDKIPVYIKNFYKKIIPAKIDRNKYMKKTINFLYNFEEILIARYSRLFDRAIRERKKVFTILIILVAATIVIKTLIKVEYIDPVSSNEFYVYLEFPTGTSLKSTEKAVLAAEEHLKIFKSIKKISTKIEKWRGTLTIKLKEDFNSNSLIEDIKKTMKQDLNIILKNHNGFAFISDASEMGGKELNISFIGNENEKLRALAKNSAGLIQRIPGIDETVLRFREGRPEYHILIDKAGASKSNISVHQIATFFRSTIFGPVITKFIDDGKEIDVRLRYQNKQRISIDQIRNYSIKNEEGKLIPVKNLVEINDKTGPTKIWRENGRRAVTITAKIGNLSYVDAMFKIDQQFKNIKFPKEYYYQYDENIERMKKNRKSMMITIVMSIILIYMILASLFESFVLPFLIMFTVPLAVIGVIFALFISFSSINISVYIGLIVLTGIVVNNGIILVDSINRGYQKGLMLKNNLTGFIKEICLTRFRPILITTITTVLGLVPMLFNSGKGSNLWQPLSLTVISGLLFSTLLTLIIMPLLCYKYYNFKFKGRFQ